MLRVNWCSVKLFNHSAHFLSITFYSRACNASNTKSMKKEWSAHLILGKDTSHWNRSKCARTTAGISTIHNQTIQSYSTIIFNYDSAHIRAQKYCFLSQLSFSSASSGSWSWSNRTKGGQPSMWFLFIIVVDKQGFMYSSGSGLRCNLLLWTTWV